MASNPSRPGHRRPGAAEHPPLGGGARSVHPVHITDAVQGPGHPIRITMPPKVGLPGAGPGHRIRATEVDGSHGCTDSDTDVNAVAPRGEVRPLRAATRRVTRSDASRPAAERPPTGGPTGESPGRPLAWSGPASGGGRSRRAAPVGTASRARRVAVAAAYGGGSLGALGALGAALYAVLVGETKLARRRIPQAQAAPPSADDSIWTAPSAVARHRGRGGSPLRIAMVGDSTAAGYGVHRDVDTPGVQLAMRLSAVSGRPVHLTSVAVVGAESAGLADQVDRALRRDPDLVVIMIGANDVTHRIRPAESVRFLSDAVGPAARRRRRGRRRDVPRSRHHPPHRPAAAADRPPAVAQPRRRADHRRGRAGRPHRVVGRHDRPGVRTPQRGWFADDHFHPSAEGYRAAVEAVLPSAVDSLGLATSTRSRHPVHRPARAAGREGGRARRGEPRHRGAGRRGGRSITWTTRPLGEDAATTDHRRRPRRTGRGHPRGVPLNTPSH